MVKIRNNRINSLVFSLALPLFAVSGAFAEEIGFSTAPVRFGSPKPRLQENAKSDLNNAGIYNMGGKLFIDRNVEVSKGFRADRYLELVSTAAPLAPQTGFARFYMSNSSNTLCAIFPNGGIGCFGAGSSTSTVIAGAINAFDPLYYDLGTGNLTLGIVSLSTGTNALTTANTWSARQTWTTPLVSTFTYGLAVGSITVTGAGSSFGTITSGNWNATVVGTQYGGTSNNLSDGKQGALPYFNGNGTMGFTSTTTSLGSLLTFGTSPGFMPVWVSSSSYIQSMSVLQPGTTFFVSSGTVNTQLRVGTFEGASLTSCGDASHALGWSGGSFNCQAISTGTAIPGGSSGQIQYNNAGALGGFASYVTASSATIYTPVLISTLNVISSVTLQGTTTNDDAEPGKWGQYISTKSAPAGQPWPNSDVIGDIVSQSLPPGDYDITGCVLFDKQATTTQVSLYMSTTAGNSGAGLVAGDNQFSLPPVTATATNGGCIANWRQSFSATTTVYLKHAVTYTGSGSVSYGRLSIRRER